MKKTYVLAAFCVFVLVICAAAFGATNGSGYASAEADQALGTPFTFQTLMDIVQTHHLTTLDQLIPLLPGRYRKHFVLMFKSGSLQSASPASPRVISYGGFNPIESIYPGENADRLYLAFQSDKSNSSKLPNSLEAIEWHPQRKDYDFYQVDFSGRSPVVQKNPEVCLSCHGNPPRPNWTAYPRWDGALGNSNGLTGAFGALLNASNQQARSEIASLQRANDRLKPLDFGEYFQIELENPNANLSSKVGGQLKVRDISLIRKRPDFNQFKYALAGAFIECTNFQDFFDPSTLRQLQRGVFAHLKDLPEMPATEVTSPDDLSFRRLWKMTAALTQRSGTHFVDYADDVEITTWLRFIYEGQGDEGASFLKNLAGTPPATPKTPSWSYDFVDFGGSLSNLGDLYLDATAQSYGDIGDLPGVSDDETEWRANQYHYAPVEPLQNGPATATCALLAKRSRRATRGFVAHIPSGTVTKLTPEAPGPRAVVRLFQQYCAHCHETAYYPPLPLENLALLSRYRTDENRSVVDRLSAHEMPPEGEPQPTEGERKEMIQGLYAAGALGH